MQAVADSSALIALATCGALDTLPRLFETISVPQAVYDEVIIPSKNQSLILAEFLKDRIMDVDSTRFVLSGGGLGKGEIEAMVLYKQIEADILIKDDRRAKAIAIHNQINSIGSLGILLVAKRRGVIESVKPYIDHLRTSSIYFGETLLEEVIKLAHE
jgi:predicted nucleic acid-binding protein